MPCCSAAIEAARLMLEHLGMESAASAIGAAVRAVLAERKVRTGDIGGTARTEEMGQAVLDRIA